MGRRKYEGTGILPGMEDPAPAERPRIPASKLVASGVAMVLLFGAALYAFHVAEQFLIRDPRFALNGPEGSEDTRTLDISGALHSSQRAIEAVFTEDEGRSVYLIPLSERRTTLRAVDWVKDASIARLWPNRLLVRVAERVPVAFVRMGSSRFGLIDDDGVILPPAKDRFHLPVLAGVRASDPLTERRDRVHRMLRLTAELGEAAQKLAEVDVSDRDNLKVAEPYDGRMLTLLLGDHNFAARYRNFANHYEEIRRKLPGAATLDLRLEDRITVVE